MNEDLLRYIDGEMEVEEAKNFEKLLESDLALKEEYNAILAAKKLSSQWIDLEIKDLLVNLSGQENSEIIIDTKPKISGTRIGIIIALLVLVGSFLWYFNRPNEVSKEEIGEEMFAYVEPVWPILRGEEDDISRAASLHLAGKTDEAIKLLEQGDNFTLEKKYWAAEILVNANRCEDALKVILEIEGLDIRNEDRLEYLRGICEEVVELE
jgi:hypothetical protein